VQSQSSHREYIPWNVYWERDEFREKAETTGAGYQTPIDEALKKHIQSPTEEGKPLTPEDLRRILREELAMRSPTP